MGDLKFGVALPYQSPAVTAQQARVAEESGWDGCFLGDAIWTPDPMIGLAAAAMVTRRVRLGTMVIPVPLRRPWKIASEALALDHLSEGRLILGLGAGATWMGWDAFPDEVTDIRARAEMLDEHIDILTLLFQRKQFDYDGKHYHLKLTQMGIQHYPPKPVQQPRVPIWVPGLWPRPRSMRRVLRCDGVIVERVDPTGQSVPKTPADVREIRAYVAANRTLDTPFDVVVDGETADLDAGERRDLLMSWQEAGATWWIEGMWARSGEEVMARLREGPPRLE
jgi:hypothetical protein